jgi:hypothetical protein
MFVSDGKGMLSALLKQMALIVLIFFILDKFKVLFLEILR